VIDHPIFGPIYSEPRTFSDGRVAYVTPLTFGRARINVGDEDWVRDGW